MRIAQLLVVEVVLASVIVFGGQLATRGGEENRTVLFAVIEALASQRPFRLEAMNRLAGTSLKEAASNDSYRVFRSASGAKSPIRAVELSLPRSAGPSGDGLLILDIDPAAGITKEAILAIFGPMPELNEPEPSAPYEVSFSYRQFHPAVADAIRVRGAEEPRGGFVRR